MGYLRKTKRAIKYQEEKAKVKKRTFWYVRTLQYKGYIIIQRPNYEVDIFKKGRFVSRTTKPKKPLTDIELRTLLDVYLKLKEETEVYDDSKDGFLAKQIVIDEVHKDE